MKIKLYENIIDNIQYDSRIMSKDYQTSMCTILARGKNVHIILLNPNIFNHLEIYFVF